MGLKDKFKKAAKKVANKTVKAAGKSIEKTARGLRDDPLEGLKGLAEDAAIGAAAGAGSLGAFARPAAEGALAGGEAALSELSGGEDAAALDLSPIVDEDEELAKQAKLIAESRRRNAPGIRQQSVFSPRIR